MKHLWEYAAYQVHHQREMYATRKVRRMLEKSICDLEGIERYALDHGVIFGPFHEMLVEGIRQIDVVLSDYGGRTKKPPRLKL